MELLTFEPLADCSMLSDFSCGVDEMDHFIHFRLENSVNNHYCQPYIVYDKTKEIVAFFALSFDSLEFDQDDIDDLFSGVSTGDVPDVDEAYIEDFKTKLHHPALEITFLAVRNSKNNNKQRKGIGRFIVDSITQLAMEQKIAG